MRKNGFLLIISGPSSSGKGTLVNLIMERAEKEKRKIWLSVSMTSRQRKKGETDGESYIFTTEEDFRREIENGGLIEYNRYGSNYYGTPKKPVEEKLQEGCCVILEIDVNGAAQVLEQFPEHATVFIMPPSLKTLEQRIRDRGRDTDEEIAVRLGEAEREIRCSEKYDYIIVNDELERAAGQLMGIIDAESCRGSRNSWLINEILDTGE